MKYTTTFKKAVLRKVLPPENRSVHSVAVEPYSDNVDLAEEICYNYLLLCTFQLSYQFVM